MKLILALLLLASLPSAAAQTASTWPTQMEGVRIVGWSAPTPQCQPVKPRKTFEGRAKSRDGALRELALEVKARGADTVQVKQLYRVKGVRVARGRAYKCESSSRD